MSDFQEDFASMLEAHGAIQNLRLNVGDKVKATVFHITGDSIFCTLSQTQEGVLPAEDVRDDDDQITVAVGDVLDAYVVRLGDTIELGLRLGKGGSMDTAALEAARESGLPVEGTVTGVNKGGLEVSLGGTRAFCPIGQADIGFVEDPAALVGKTMSFLVREIKERGRNVVVSRRAVLEQERAANRQKTLAELEVGQSRTGVVTRVADFGLFVDLGGVNGLVPMSELAHHRVGKADDIAKVGDTVQVEIKKIEADSKGQTRIGLSMKALLPAPLDVHAGSLREGAVLDGRVTKLATFGAFVELFPGVEGLVHIGEMADRRIGHPAEVVKVGEAVTVRVLGVDRERERISLSLKAQRAPKAQGGAPRVGDVVTGKVDRIEPYGVFIALEGGRSALLPGAESKTPPGTNLRNAFPLGTELTAAIVAIDDRGRIKVSLKALEEAEEREAIASFSASTSQGGLGTLGDLLAAKKRRR